MFRAQTSVLMVVVNYFGSMMRAVKTVSLTKDGAAGIIRFNLKENNASTAADQISIGRSNGVVRVSIPAKLQSAAAPLTGVKSSSHISAAERSERDFRRSSLN
jgi:hypothetical protein